MNVDNYKIPINSLLDYLGLNNWSIENSRDENLFIATSQDGSLKMLIPKSESLEDYSMRIKRVIKNLATIYNLNEQLLKSHIVFNNYIPLSLRFKSPQVRDGTILVEESEKLFEQIRQAIKYAACSSIIEKNNFGKKSFNQAESLVKSCRFAQTEIGSFVINILVPKEQIYLSHTSREGVKPNLSEETVKKLFEGIEYVKDNTTTLENCNQHRKVISSNFCRSISKILLMDSTSLGVDSQFIKQSDAEEFNKEIFIEHSLTSKFVQFADHLEKKPDDEEVEIEAKITKLQRDESPHREEKRLVIIRAKDIPKNIHVVLGGEDYNVACDAHKNKQKIYARGILHKRENGHWFLEDPEYFQTANPHD